MDFTRQTGSERIACFDKRRYKLFEDVNHYITNGLSTKIPQIVNNDIITNYRKTTIERLDKTATKESEVTEIEKALSQEGSDYYEQFHVKGIYSNISDD